MASDLRPRHVQPVLFEALQDTRVVVVQGARQVGKTTLIAEVTRQVGGRLVTLDDELTRSAAEADPSEFLAQYPDGLLAIDEAQRVPGLVLALKLAVDRDPRPGRFLLTGSANLLRLPAMQDSLAGRAENVDLFGFSQGELTGQGEDFLSRLFDGDRFLGHDSELRRADYVAIACAGGYPEALSRAPGRRRAAWFDNYVRRIVERDAPDISGLHRLAELPKLLALLAARNATELNVAGLANDAGIPTRTLEPYLDLLETLYLIQRIPTWSTNLSHRVVSRPKIVLNDSGLAAQLINISPAGAAVGANAEAAGNLLESFVVSEIRRQLSWSDVDARLYHYRDRAGAEVDVILEAADGRVVGIEIKASSAVTARDTKWLHQLRERLGNRFIGGLVLHTGQSTTPFGAKITATPIDTLWNA